MQQRRRDLRWQSEEEEMQKNLKALGRPTGTDGSDFLYRMVVDPRYTKVAKLRSRLGMLMAAQAVNLITMIMIIFMPSKLHGPLYFYILSGVIGSISLLIGELGRRRNMASLLRLYTTGSSMATALSVACLVRSDFFTEVIQTRNFLSMEFIEMAEVGRIFIFGIILQIALILTSISLVQNMSPKRS